MLRGLSVGLVMANLAYFAWSQGWLLGAGFLPHPWPQTEPERLSQQIRDDQVRLLRPAPEAPGPARAQPVGSDQPPEPPATTVAAAPPDAAGPAASAPPDSPPPTTCLQLSGPLNDRQFASLRAELTGKLPDSAWTVGTSIQPPRWIVYSGKFSSTELMASRKAELRQLQVDYREVSNPTLQPGLAMGTYSTETGAQQALRDVTKAGVRGAKVMVERPEATLYTFRLPEATPETSSEFRRLVERMSSDVLKGKSVQVCS
jgi:hypothetical protein